MRLALLCLTLTGLLAVGCASRFPTGTYSGSYGASYSAAASKDKMALAQTSGTTEVSVTNEGQGYVVQILGNNLHAKASSNQLLYLDPGQMASLEIQGHGKVDFAASGQVTLDPSGGHMNLSLDGSNPDSKQEVHLSFHGNRK